MRFLNLTGSLLFLAFFTITLNASAQLSANDSAVYTASVKNALTIYHRSLEKPSGLFNGSQYVIYSHLIRDDHPYFQSDSMNIGNIVYDGVLFENVPMYYDLVKEMIVINDPYKIYRLSLINEKVSSFEVLDHKFIRLETDSLNHRAIATGFYDVLYKGTINLYERELKKMQEVITNQELYRIIIPQNNFYLEIAGEFHSVNSKRSFLKLMGDRKKEIQQFIKKNKLNYRKDKENTLIRAVSYYDTLLTANKNNNKSGN